MHFLVFSLHYGRDLGLDQGSLTLNHLEDGFLKVWRATSSTTGEQKKKAEQFKWGGVLPANKHTKNKNYSVVLTPVNKSNNKGVAGNFYPIKPHVIKTINGTYLSDVGIHLGGLALGSPGCIVMNEFNFDGFEEYMDDLRKRGIKEIPLFVQYV